MKVNLGDKPVIPFFEGADDAFSLTLKHVTGADQMAVLDAIANDSFVGICEAVSRLVENWSGVMDENGRAIPFEGTDDKGEKTRNIDVFFGAIGMMRQMEVMLGIASFLGMPGQMLKTTLENLRRLTGEAPAVDPTSPPEGDTPPTASTSSAS